MARAAWTPIAESDLEEIVVYIAERDRRRLTARKIYEEIRDKCDEYAVGFIAGSTLGTARPELGADYRSFSHKRWTIVFRPTETGIEILRVFDASRDYPHLFS